MLTTKKLSILLQFLVLTIALNISAQSSYSWLSCNSPTSFLPPKADQYYQGPCVAYALTAALESKIYKEYGQFYDLSELYVDRLVFSAGRNLGSLNNLVKNVKIPVNTGANNFPDNSCEDPTGNVTCLINGCNIKATITTSIPFNSEYCFQFSVSSYGAVTNYATVSSISAKTFTSNYFIKAALKNGPIIMRVNGASLSDFFTGRSLPNSEYHTVLIYGWETIDDKIVFLAKDSWPNSPNSVTLKHLSDATILNLQSSGSLEFATIGVVNKSGSTKMNSCIPNLSSIGIMKVYATFFGDNYARCIVNSDVEVDDWEWSVSAPYSSRNLFEGKKLSTILISPLKSGQITIKVRAKKDGVWSSWQILNTYLSNDGVEWGGGLF